MLLVFCGLDSNSLSGASFKIVSKLAKFHIIVLKHNYIFMMLQVITQNESSKILLLGCANVQKTASWCCCHCSKSWADHFPSKFKFMSLALIVGYCQDLKHNYICMPNRTKHNQVGLATLLEGVNNKFFEVNFRNFIFLYLWVFSYVQVGKNGAYSKVKCQSSCFVTENSEKA